MTPLFFSRAGWVLGLSLAWPAGPLPAQETPAPAPAPTAAPAPAAASASGVVAAQGDRVALVIGNDDYPEAGNFPDLANCRNDARLIRGALEAAGFTVIFREDADWHTLDESVTLFENTIPKGGTAVFYFAGHGIEVEGKNYLMGSNAKLQARSRLGQEGFDAETVAQAMLLAGAKSSFLFLDCCRESPPVEWLSRGIKKRGLADLKVVGDIVICFAALPGQSAMDAPLEGVSAAQVPGLPSVVRGNSPYAQALAHAMPLGLDHLRMFQRVRNDVNALTGGQQRTWESGSFLNDFYFTAPQVSATVAPGGAMTKPVPSPTGTGAEPETAAELARQREEMKALQALVAKLQGEGAAAAKAMVPAPGGQKVTLMLDPSAAGPHGMVTLVGTQTVEVGRKVERADVAAMTLVDPGQKAPEWVEDGQVATALRMTRVRGSRSVSENIQAAFDSAAGPEMPAELGKVGALLDTQLMLLQEADGTVLNLWTAEERISETDAPLMGQAVDFLGGVPLVLPPGAVAAGDAWRGLVKVRLLGEMALAGSLDHRLVALDGTTAKVAVSGAMDVVEGGPKGAAMRVLGEVTVARADGLPLASLFRLDLQAGTGTAETPAGQPESFRVVVLARRVTEGEARAEEAVKAQVSGQPLPGLPHEEALRALLRIELGKRFGDDLAAPAGGQKVTLMLDPSAAGPHGMLTLTKMEMSGMDDGVPIRGGFDVAAITLVEPGEQAFNYVTRGMRLVRAMGRNKDPDAEPEIFDTLAKTEEAAPYRVRRLTSLANRDVRVRQEKDGLVTEVLAPGGEEGLPGRVPEGFPTMLGGYQPRLPVDAASVAVGESWPAEVKLSLAPGMEAEAALRHTLEAVDSTTATISIAGTLRLVGAAKHETPSSAKVTGTVRLSREDGLPRSSQFQVEMAFPEPQDEQARQNALERVIIVVAAARQREGQAQLSASDAVPSGQDWPGLSDLRKDVEAAMARSAAAAALETKTTPQAADAGLPLTLPSPLRAAFTMETVSAARMRGFEEGKEVTAKLDFTSRTRHELLAPGALKALAAAGEAASGEAGSPPQEAELAAGTAAVLKISVEALKTHLLDPKGGESVFDSANPAANSGKEGAADGEFARVMRTPAWLELDARGLPPAEARSRGSAETFFRGRLLGGGSVALPEPGTLVVPGLSWRAEWRDRLVGDRVLMNVTHRVKSVAADGATVTLDLEGTMTALDYEGKPREGERSFTSSRVSGSAVLSRADGLPLSIQLTAEAAIQRETPTANGPHGIEVSVEAKRLAPGAAE